MNLQNIKYVGLPIRDVFGERPKLTADYFQIEARILGYCRQSYRLGVDSYMKTIDVDLACTPGTLVHPPGNTHTVGLFIGRLIRGTVFVVWARGGVIDPLKVANAIIAFRRVEKADRKLNELLSVLRENL